MAFESIPNDVRNRLGNISKDIADANLNFGQSIASSWPGYPNPGVHSRQAIFDFTCKWEEKFKFKVGGVEHARDAFTIQFKYSLYNSTEEGRTIMGMPITVPYDMTGLPAPAVKGDGTPNIKQRAEMALSRVSTQLRMLLGVSEDEFKQRVAAGTIVAILEAVGNKLNQGMASGIPLCGRVNFVLKKYSYQGQDGQPKEGLDATDTIVEVTSADPAATAALVASKSEPPV